MPYQEVVMHCVLSLHTFLKCVIRQGVVKGNAARRGLDLHAGRKRIKTRRLVQQRVVAKGLVAVVVTGLEVGGGTAEAEVAESDRAIGVDENVSGLDVSVHDAARMHVIEGSQQSVHHNADLFHVQKDRTSRQLAEVRLN